MYSGLSHLQRPKELYNGRIITVWTCEDITPLAGLRMDKYWILVDGVERRREIGGDVDQYVQDVKAEIDLS